MNKKVIYFGLVIVLIMTISIASADNEGEEFVKEITLTGGTLETVCVSYDRYGKGTKLQWYTEGDDDCYLCTRTGTCSDRCYKYLEVCYNLAWPLWEMFF